MRMTRMSKRRRQTRRAMQDSKNRVAVEIPLEHLIEIPLELLIEILARLPAKSVMRFKCVSKFWSSLFCSRYFCNRFLMVPSRHQPRLYMTLLDCCYYYKSVILSSAKSGILSSASGTSASSLVFDQDLTIRKIGGFDLRVLRGFMCFTVDFKAQIYNPSTRQLVILPAIESDLLADIVAEELPYQMLNFIGHDPVTDQYKVLCTITKESDDIPNIRSEHWVFVLETGGSWKRKMVTSTHRPSLFELNMNGALHYVAWTDLHTYVLMRFDIKSEDLNMIQVPRRAGDVLPRHMKRLTQINYGGKVAVFDITNLTETGTTDLWVVEDWEKKEWSQKTMVLEPSQMHLVIGKVLIPKGTFLKGKVILYPQELIYPFYFLRYDLQSNDLKKVEIKGISDRWFNRPDETKDFDMDFMDPSENIMYLEI